MKLKEILAWQEALKVHVNAARMGSPKHNFYGYWWWAMYYAAKDILDR